LLFDRNAPNSYIGYLQHALSYPAIDKRLVDLDNYEPGTGYFPIIYRRTIAPPDIIEIEARPAEVDLDAYASRAQYLVTWKMPDAFAANPSLQRDYRLLVAVGDGSLYASRRRPFLHEAIVLLPVAGTVGEVGTAHGARWHVDQTMRNNGSVPVHVIVTACAMLPSCDFNLPPGQSVRLATTNSVATPYVLIRADWRDVDHLAFSTIVRTERFQVGLPAVRERDLRSQRIVIPDVVLNRRARANLRLWTFRAPRPVRYTVVLQSADGQRTFARRVFATGPDGFQIHADLQRDFTELAELDVRADVVVELNDTPLKAQLWAFITVTNNQTNLPSLRLPR
jgi:hypothetical protein